MHVIHVSCTSSSKSPFGHPPFPMASRKRGGGPAQEVPFPTNPASALRLADRGLPQEPGSWSWPESYVPGRHGLFYKHNSRGPSMRLAGSPMQVTPNPSRAEPHALSRCSWARRGHPSLLGCPLKYRRSLLRFLVALSLHPTPEPGVLTPVAYLNRTIEQVLRMYFPIRYAQY